jgi:hypothetical protein
MHIFRMLADLSDRTRRARTEQALRQIESDPSATVDAVTYDLMSRLI